MGIGGLDIFIIVLVLLAVLVVFLWVKTVPQGYNWTVERLGRCAAAHEALKSVAEGVMVDRCH